MRRTESLREGIAEWRRAQFAYLGLSCLAHAPLLAYTAYEASAGEGLAWRWGCVAPILGAATVFLALGAVAGGVRARRAREAIRPATLLRDSMRETAPLLLAVAFCGAFLVLWYTQDDFFAERLLPQNVLGFALVGCTLLARAVPRAVLDRRGLVGAFAGAERGRFSGSPSRTQAAFLALLIAYYLLVWRGIEEVGRPDSGAWALGVVLALEVLVVCPLAGVLDAVAHLRNRDAAGDVAEVFD